MTSNRSLIHHKKVIMVFKRKKGQQEIYMVFEKIDDFYYLNNQLCQLNLDNLRTYINYDIGYIASTYFRNTSKKEHKDFCFRTIDLEKLCEYDLLDVYDADQINLNELNNDPSTLPTIIQRLPNINRPERIGTSNIRLLPTATNASLPLKPNQVVEIQNFLNEQTQMVESATLYRNTVGSEIEKFINEQNTIAKSETFYRNAVEKEIGDFLNEKYKIVPAQKKQVLSEITVPITNKRKIDNFVVRFVLDPEKRYFVANEIDKNLKLHNSHEKLLEYIRLSMNEDTIGSPFEKSGLILRFRADNLPYVQIMVNMRQQIEKKINDTKLKQSTTVKQSLMPKNDDDAQAANHMTQTATTLSKDGKQEEDYSEIDLLRNYLETSSENHFFQTENSFPDSPPKEQPFKKFKSND